MRVGIWNSPRLHGAALFALTLAVWHGVPRGTFQFDDYRAILSAPVGLAWRIRPLLALTWQWDLAVYGQRAAGFLAENLILHCLSVLFVYGLARRILSPLGAFLAGVAFALQPAHSEVIAYVSGRSTGLMALLILAALWLSNRAADSQRPALRRGLFGLALVLFIAAVLVKEVALVFPLLLWVWGSVAERKPHLLRRVFPFAAAAGVLAVGLAAIPRYRALAAWSIAQHGPLDGLAINASSLSFQLSLWLRPRTLSVEHSLEDAALPLIPAVAILAVLASIAWTLRHRPW